MFLINGNWGVGVVNTLSKLRKKGSERKFGKARLHIEFEGNGKDEKIKESERRIKKFEENKIIACAD